MTKTKMRTTKTSLAIFLATVILFLFLEGIASTMITAAKLISRVSKEKVYTQYDSELGWIAIPDLYNEDMYGDGIFLQTNAQNFRHSDEVQMNVPDGKVRVVCSGDSFTFGHGVDNDHTWCNLLAMKNNKLETVNLGQVGYGIGQSFLLFDRVQAQLNHQIHVFAFITDDFHRAGADSFLGYPKPKLVLRDGKLIADNVPVPKRLFSNPHLIVAAEALTELRLVHLIRRVFGASAKSLPYPVSNGIDVAQTRKIVITVFEELRRISKKNKSQIALVYLPAGEWDYRSQDPVTEAWRNFLESEASKRGWLYVDLIKAFNRLETDAVIDLFDRHYTVAGNEFIAERLYDRLMAVPEIAELVN